MAIGPNAESGNERRSEDHRDHRPHHQDLNDSSNGRESLKGCPVGQPANEDRSNTNRDDRSELIAKHRLDKQGEKISRNLPGTEQYGLGRTGTKMNHLPKESGADHPTVQKKDYNVYFKGACNFDSPVSTAPRTSYAHSHRESVNDHVDGVSSGGSNVPTRHQGTTRITASSNQYQTRNLNTERDRLSTYFDWPREVPVAPEDLARQGFFYLGDRDRVECAFCGGVLHQWEAGDDPFIEHQRHYPHCPFVNGEATANVPLGATSPQTSPPTGRNTAQGVVISQASQQFSTPAHGTLSQVTQRTGFGNTSLYALPVGTELPKQPDFADEQSRLSTFHNWPRYSPMSPLRLARAGFVYTYVADHVRCYWCDGGLKDWQQDDDPWEEHARWYGSECGYVIMNKGMDYIREVRTRRPPVVQQPQYRWGIEASIIQSILEMGFGEERIQAVVQNHWQRYNRPFTTATELLTALLPQEEVPFYPPEDEEEPPFAFQNAPVVPPPPAARLPPIDEQPLDPETMERELRRLREERQCKVCLSADACMVFIPCGHLCCCEHCANMLRMRGRRCPLCRALFQRVQRAFLA